MFKAVLSDVDVIKNSIPIIAEILDEASFTFDKNGIFLLSPDRTMVSVVDFKILSSAFDEYQADGEKKIGLNMANLSAIVKRLNSDDKVDIKLGENKVIFTVSGKATRKFEIPIIDVKIEKPPVEQLDFTAKAEMESNVMEEGIADAELIGDSIVFEANPDSLKMMAKGDVSSTQLEVKKGQDGLLNLETKEQTKAQYPLDYLKRIIKAAKLSPQLSLEFASNYPMRIIFKSIDKIQLSFILAPRVSD